MSDMFEDKLRQLREQIKKEKLDGVFISSVSNISYLTGFTNFSKEEREAYLLIGDNFQYIITDGRYSEAVKKEIPHLILFERGGGKTTEDLFKKVKAKIKTLAIEEDNITVSEYKFIIKHFKNLKHFEIAKLRVIKQKEELERIQKACNLADKAFEYIFKKIKQGITEKQVAYELEKFIKENGGEFSFPAIVAFGKNSSIPHHHTGQTKLTKSLGQFVLLDFGVRFENYCSDMTRTVFFGKPSRKQKEIYQTVYEAQQKAVDLLNLKIKTDKKVVAQEVDKSARDYILSKGYPSIPHSLGHGIGLEVHERPYISPKGREVLKEGMVFSIEPGVYIPGFGGVRIEDLFIIEKDKIKQITNSPKDLIVI